MGSSVYPPGYVKNSSPWSFASESPSMSVTSSPESHSVANGVAVGAEHVDGLKDVLYFLGCKARVVEPPGRGFVRCRASGP